MKITVHDEMRIFFAFHIENNCKNHASRLLDENHYSQGRKLAISHFKGNKKCR